METYSNRNDTSTIIETSKNDISKMKNNINENIEKNLMDSTNIKTISSLPNTNSITAS